MNGTLPPFGVNTYSYSQRWTAEDCVRSFADQGHASVELMMYPGHLWPADMDAAARRDFKARCHDRGIKLISTNAPNIDINVAAATNIHGPYLRSISGVSPAGQPARLAA